LHDFKKNNKIKIDKLSLFQNQFLKNLIKNKYNNYTRTERDNTDCTIREAIAVLRKEDDMAVEIKVTSFIPKDNSVPNGFLCLKLKTFKILQENVFLMNNLLLITYSNCINY
jgi:hypothetical protein